MFFSPTFAFSPALIGRFFIPELRDFVKRFSYQQARSVKCLSFVGETNAQGAWIGRNGEWEDWSTRQLGSLSIEGIIEGEGLPQYNLSVLDMKRCLYLPPALLRLS